MFTDNNPCFIDRAARSLIKTGSEQKCSRILSSSCSNNGTRSGVTQVNNLAIIKNVQACRYQI